MAKTVVGVFDEHASGERADAALEAAGFSRSDISMMASESVRDVESGGVVTKGDSGVGAMDGGAIGALTSLGVPKEDSEHFAEAIRRGGTLVAARAETDADAESAARIMSDFGAIDIERRAASWRERGYAGFDMEAKPLSRDELIRERDSLPVIEEQLEVGKREVDLGAVRVYTHVSEVPVSKDVRLREERAVVERRAVDRPATGAELQSFVEGEIEVTERGEVPVVAKTARVVEEVTVGTEVEERTETIRDTVRRTDVEVERTAAGRGGKYDTYAGEFREDFDRKYAGGRGLTWESHEPAYRYGYDLSGDPGFAARDWDASEGDIRARWENDRPGTWESMKDAIRHAWQRARGTMARDRGAQPRR